MVSVALLCGVAESPISSGTSVNARMESTQKINATGGAAEAPSVCERQSRSHVADIAVRTGSADNRRLRDVAVAKQHTDHERNREYKGGRYGDTCDKWQVAEFIGRRFRQHAKEQTGQRNIDQEEIHPGEAAIGQGR